MGEKLVIKDLYVSVEGKEILKGINLELNRGEIHALMGPNGSGKSTLAHVLMGHPKYQITKGKILIDGEDITELSPDKRAKLGLFLSFQHPQEIPGVTVSNFLRTAYNSLKGENVPVMVFYEILKEKMGLLEMDASFTKRYLNQGFSGGEKKKTEILQMLILNPLFVVLDETDSGTDVDALKIIADGINKIRDNNNTGCLLITHYNRILKYVKPNKVTIIVNGKIVDRGDAKLADEIEANGYTKYGNGNGN